MSSLKKDSWQDRGTSGVNQISVKAPAPGSAADFDKILFPLTVLQLCVSFSLFCFFNCTHSLGLARTGGGPLLAEARASSSSHSVDASLSSSSSSSGSLKCTCRPTLEPERESLWFVKVPDLRQEFGGGSGRGTTTRLPFWWFGVPLTLTLVSDDVSQGRETSCSAGVAALKGFRCENTCAPPCGSGCAPLDMGVFW